MTVSLIDPLGREVFQFLNFLPAGQDQVITVDTGFRTSSLRQMFCVVTLKNEVGMRRSVLPLTFR